MTIPASSNITPTQPLGFKRWPKSTQPAASVAAPLQTK
ncbi:hypothetical protein LTSEJOH_2692 [Salmonella enterica subsp. enterica serovar Johannesburg str. S5-703]|nr:hypothetical protein LTSEJOH_2692 [Salmonella enterica subsp. enterica serovar Johannesburg str. S5-703]